MDTIIGDDERQSLLDLGKWISTALISGVAGASILRSFVVLTTGMDRFFTGTSLPPLIWPLAGALFTGLVIYRITMDAAGEGMPSYIRGIVIDQGDLPFKATFFKYVAALITLGTYGNGGIVGPLGRVAAGTSSVILGGLKRISPKFTQNDVRVAGICGMAAFTGSVFHSSIGAGLFAVEVIHRRSINYKDLFPAILSSCTAVLFSKALGWESYYGLTVHNSFMDLRMIGWLVLFAMLIGLAGGLYNITYKKIAVLFRRDQGQFVPKLLLGSFLAFSLAYTVNPQLVGTSKGIFMALSRGDLSAIFANLPTLGRGSLALLIIVVVKVLSNCLTVGSGMNAGFTGPALLTGMLLGAAASLFLGLEVGSATYHAFMAAGFAGMLASTVNVPLAAAVLAVEVFGLSYSFPAGLSAIIGFQMMRSSFLYDSGSKGNLTNR